MVVPGKSCEITDCLGNSRELFRTVLCLMWQWHGSILSLGRASLLPANSHAWFSVRCFSAVGKVLFVIPRSVLGPFVFSMLRLRNLMLVKPCRRLLLFSAKLLLPHAHFHCLLTILCRGIPRPPHSCPSGRPISDSKLAKYFHSSCWCW